MMYDVTENDEFDREEIATYEEVARLFPRPGIYRPVVLVGPPGVGRNELKRRLIALDPDRYRATIPRESQLFRAISVTRFGEISPLWQKFTNIWQISDRLFLFGKC